MSNPDVPLEPIVVAEPSKPKKRFIANDFEWTEKPMGKGSFGSVFKCREKKNDFPVAIKAVKKTILTADDKLLQLTREIELQTVLLHKNIVILYGFFDNYDYVFIILELCTLGTLSRMLRREKCLAVSRASYYADCIADALDYCHARNVIHRDVKPANVLITASMEPKLADFGFAVHDVDFRRETVCGTPSYLSPEMLNDDTNHAHTTKVDNWALGVLFYECLTGRTPFRATDQATTFRNIVNAKIECDSKVSNAAMTVIKGLLTVNVEKRLGLKEFRQNPFVQSEVNKYQSANN
uniref:Aurora kinase n=1 Tax=Panagrellus redivivus TaxID=6233 RepID=A0A7E4W0U1_PANRE